MDQMMPLLFTLLPMAGMALAAKSRKKVKIKTDLDSDVVVKDSGGKRGKAPGILVSHRGLGLPGGDTITNVKAVFYEDDNGNHIDLQKAIVLVIKFGNKRTLRWDITTHVMTVKLGGKPQSDNELVLGGENVGTVDLSATNGDGSFNELSTLIAPGKVFFVRLARV